MVCETIRMKANEVMKAYVGHVAFEISIFELDWVDSFVPGEEIVESKCRLM